MSMIGPCMLIYCSFFICTLITMQKILLLTICTSIAISCSSNPASEKKIHLVKGDTVKLNRSFSVAKLSSHVIFQDGEIIKQRDLQRYETSCIIDTKSLGPETIQPGDFEVKKVTYNDEWYSDAAAELRYYTEFYLNAVKQDKELILTCQTLDDTMRRHTFPADEIKQATGDYLIFSSIDNKP